MRIYIGIDPGKSGAMSWLTDDIDDGLKSVNMKNTNPLDLDSWFKIFKEQTRDWLDQKDALFIMMERVWSFPRDSGKAAFSFGMNCGMWKTLLETNELPYIEVLPRKWQGHFNVPKLNKRERKLLLKNKASKHLEEHEEEYKATYSNSDAILIALYCKSLSSPS
tara:strand:- start:667 stop:1158 length:492 start_codon:yes stop_codon:yes gene_type:complete